MGWVAAGGTHASWAMELGDEVPEALAVHVTNGGLSRIGDLVEALVPPTLEVESGSGEFACSEEDENPLAYTLDELDLILRVDEVDVSTADGRLDLTLYATLLSSAASLAVTGDCSVLTDLDEVCGVELPTTALVVRLSVALDQVDGVFEATAEEVSIEMSPVGNPLSDCTLADAIGTLLGQDESFLSNLILSMVEPSLSDLGPTIETALEDALAGLALETELDLGGTPLGLALVPAVVRLDEAGIFLGLSARITVENPSDCVPWEEGFVAMEAGWPEVSELAATTSMPYDFGLFVGRDFVDQALFSIWAGGALCMEISDLNGAPLTNGLLASLLGESLEEVLDPNGSALLAIDPVEPPTVRFSDDAPVFHIDIQQLGLHLYTSLEHRDLRLFQVDVTADAGLDIDLSTEALNTGLVLDEGSLIFRETWTDLAEPGFGLGVQSLASAAIQSVLPEDLLPSITLPSLLGLEIDAVVWLPSENEAWHGGYVVADTSMVEPVELPGCSASDLGCDGGGPSMELDFDDLLGCDEASGGCESSGGGACASMGVIRLDLPLGRLAPLFCLVLGVGVRRRRR